MHGARTSWSDRAMGRGRLLRERGGAPVAASSASIRANVRVACW